jgi:hypothetical protein
MSGLRGKDPPNGDLGAGGMKNIVCLLNGPKIPHR